MKICIGNFFHDWYELVLTKVKLFGKFLLGSSVYWYLENFSKFIAITMKMFQSVIKSLNDILNNFCKIWIIFTKFWYNFQFVPRLLSFNKILMIFIINFAKFLVNILKKIMEFHFQHKYCPPCWNLIEMSDIFARFVEILVGRWKYHTNSPKCCQKVEILWKYSRNELKAVRISQK